MPADPKDRSGGALVSAQADPKDRSHANLAPGLADPKDRSRVDLAPGLADPKDRSHVDPTAGPVDPGDMSEGEGDSAALTPGPEDRSNAGPRRRTAAASSADPRRDLARIDALKDHLRSARLLLGLVALLGISSLVGASTTATPRSLYLHLGLWFLGQAAAIVAVLVALRWLRRRRLGALPSTRLRRRSDAVLYVAAAVGGALALLGFVPRITTATAEAIDWIIALIGLVLLVVGLRAALLHVLRP